MATAPGISAADFLPERWTLSSLTQASIGCRGCDLYKNATQTVFGEGASRAQVVLVGEQPGDREDLSGHPFVGPAGRVLDRALADADIPRASVYVTNAVKHFKWEPRGKRRIHKRPRDREIEACYPWLGAEVEVIGPKVVVCMWVTAARAAFGKTVRLKALRGTCHPTRLANLTFVTLHPSALLRIEDRADRHATYDGFVEDLRRVRERLNN